MALSEFEQSVRRRLRLFAIGLAIIVVACVAGLWINHDQQQTLKHQTKTLQKHQQVIAELAIPEEQAQILAEVTET